MVRAIRVALSFCIIFAAVNSIAQKRPHVAAPHKEVPKRVEKSKEFKAAREARTMVGGLWMTDANWKSALYLRNNVETDSIQVTPVLYLSNGVKYTLPQVTLEPAANAIIDINGALQKQGISSWATLSGYVELQYNWPWDPLCATIRNIDTVHSLIFAYSLRPTLPSPVYRKNFKPATVLPSVEGMWWKHEANVTGFVSVANTSGQAAQTTVQTLDNQGNVIARHDVTVSPHGMKLVNLDELLSTTATQGAVRVTSTQPMDKLVVNGGLEDSSSGYSIGMPFTAPQKVDLPDQPAQVEIAALGIMTGAADPMMAFPAGTVFTPYSVLRNASDAPVTLTPTLWWMESGAPRSSELPPVTVPANQTFSMDMPSLLARYGPKNFNGSFNLVLDGALGDSNLLMSAGSVDQTNSYVFETVPRGVGESTAKSLQYWSTGNGDDTMITVWNPADEPQDFVLTLYFAGGQYALPLHLEARATRSLNVSEIAMNQVPDKDGKIIPASVREGSAILSGSQAENQAILVALDSGVYNVKKATCSNYCTYCYGYSDGEVVIDGFEVPVAGNTREYLYAQYMGGGQYDLSGGSTTWNSNNTGVATVSTGMVNGVSAGSAIISATSGFVTINEGYICFGPNPIPCPQGKMGGSSPGTVADFNISSAQTIMDGQQSSFAITITAGTPNSYLWSFTSPQGAGNSPNVQFSESTSASTGTDGHWFASPNDTCNASLTATYTIKGTVNFQGAGNISKTTQLNVTVPTVLAQVDPNQATITGSPDDAQDPNTHLWVVTGQGTLARQVPTAATYNISTTSQFYNKAQQHEQVHLNNWVAGTGHLFGDLFIVGDFYNEIKSLNSAAGEQDLLYQIRDAKSDYITDQQEQCSMRHSTDEQQAYAVSDSVAPMYLFQSTCPVSGL